MAKLPVPSNAPEIGECIYCGSRDEPLYREHAVPYGLNGPWTLRRASCGVCAAITHRFERDTLRGLLRAVRIVLSLQTRRRHERPGTLPLVLESSGVQRVVQVQPNEFPLYLPTPLFPPPGAVSGKPPGQELHAEMKFVHIAGPTFEEAAKRYPESGFIGARLNFAPEEFARTLAKIGFCAAVYALGVEPFRSSPIRSIILGNDRCVGHWVGSWTGEVMNEDKGLHEMQVRASGTDVHVILRLFAQFRCPEYHIVLGPAAPEFVNSEAWPWK